MVANQVYSEDEMEKLYEYLPRELVTFVLVTLFSLLIGLSQRKISLKREGETTLFGTDRTFTFIGILGYLLYILDPVDYRLFMGGGAILGLLLGLNYYVKQSQFHVFGVTTIIIALITYCIAPIVATQPSWFYVMVVVTVLLFTELKHTFTELAQRMKNDEMITLAKFLAISGIILPMLPNENLIPDINLTPYTVWLATVVVSGISYLSYLLRRYVFHESGILVSGIIGGLYSSTATISVLARKSRKAPAQEAPEYAAAMLLAVSMMFLRFLILIGIFSKAILAEIYPYLLIMSFVTAGVAWYLHRKRKSIPVTGEEAEEEDEVTEEDLRRAEEEFLHGPMGNTDLNPEDDTEGTEEAQPLTEEEELERFIESIQPENGADPRDIVPREKELTDDEKQLFTYFVKVPGMKEQLVDTLYDVQMAAADKTSKTGNIIVMGGKECGKTRLISGLIPAICKELNLEASKVAYVFADQINGKNIYKIFSKLAGGFLVIENANQLTPETVEMLDKAMEVNTDGLTVIVEDEKIGMRKLIARYPKFAKKFTSMINIPVFTNDELVNFARVYTKENGYAIDQMGMLALYNLIGINQKEDSPMNVGAVKELIDAAIAKSQGGIRKFKRNVSKKRIDRDGYIVLYEKDFTK